MSRTSGQAYEITLTGDIDSTSTRITFSSVTFNEPIPAGSIVLFKQADKWDKINTSYQYLHFVGDITAGTATNWKHPGSYGVSHHTWNQDGKTSGTTVGTSTMEVAKQHNAAGIRIPYDCTLIGFYGGGRNNNGNRQFAAGLFVGEADWGTTTTTNPTLRAYAEADNDGGSYTNRPSKLEDLSRSFSISQGEQIYPAIKSLNATNDTIQAAFTVVLKTTKV